MMITKSTDQLKSQMTGWIKEMTKWPHRKTGTKEGIESAEYVRDVFHELGLQDINIETADSLCTEVLEAELYINGRKIESLLSNGTNRKNETGISKTDVKDVDIVYIGKGGDSKLDDVEVNGKIVVCDINFIPHIWGAQPGAKLYSTNGEFERKRNIYNVYMPENYIENYFAVMDRGAVGFIGILRDYMDEYFINEDYNFVIDKDELMRIPTMWVSSLQGENIIKNINGDHANRGSIKVKIVTEYRKAYNVMGMIEGSSDDITVVHSHHDAVTKGAVQDASGMSVVFALAQYFSTLPKEKVKTNMLFLSTDSHYTDYEGHDEFINRREEEGKNIVLDFCIEHIAKEMDLGKDNEMIIYDRPETRLLFATDYKGLANMAFDIFRANEITNTILMVASPKGSENFDPDFVCTDAYCFHERGIPVVSLLSAPMYLAHISDTYDKVYEKDLVPVANTYVEMLFKAWELLGY